jgi:prophage regulatory protein
MASRILRLKTVIALTGLSRSTIYLRIAQGSFSKPRSLGARAVGWLESDIESWIANLQAKP